MQRAIKFLRDDAAATAMEYGMILGLVGAAILVAINLFYTNLATIFFAWAGWFTSPSTTNPVGGS
ncbi:MAG: Flp family type IVb pilin [Deltaproteobacteria bacterium]|nr:Flp family type IVb pilin [Deltaproteobacteria bacterium]